MFDSFEARVARLATTYQALIVRPNEVEPSWDNGVYLRYRHPVISAAHVPLEWRYDFDPHTNPFLLERLAVNATLNAGALELGGTVLHHTIKEAKNGEGPPPIKTPQGWLHLAHGVRDTAAGLRYVLYLYLSELERPWVVTHRPAGYFMAPEGAERVGDVSNVLFANGWVARPDGTVLIYYASSDTRLHVATSTLDRLLDYVLHTPEDGLRSATSVQQRLALIRRNQAIL